MSLPPHALRPGEPGDRGYIIDSWLQSYRHSPFAAKLPDFAYWSRFGHVGVVESLLADPDTRVKVACLPDGGAWLYGYVVYTYAPSLILHYLFVAPEFRGIGAPGEGGFGRLLLGISMDTDSMSLSHLTADFSRRLARGRAVKFVNPYRRTT